MTEALAEKEREVQMYLAYRRDDGDAQQAEAECYKVQPGDKEEMQTQLTGDDRSTLPPLFRTSSISGLETIQLQRFDQ